MASSLAEVAGECTPCRVGLVPVDLDREKIGSGTSSGSKEFRPLDSLGIREVVTYQPASRYWPIQGIETAISLALALARHCLWRLNRRMPDGRREGWPADSLGHLVDTGSDG